jgi:RDD family
MTEYPPGPPPGNYPPPPSPSGGGYPPPGNYPPPPAGNYPPPPPQAGGYPPPPPGGYAPIPPGGAYGAPPPPGGVIGLLPQQAYTSWVTRVLAFIIDYIPYLIIVGLGWGIMMGTQECVDFSDTGLGDILGDSYGAAQVCGASTLGQTAVTLAGLLGLAYMIWNYGYRQGTTGSSIGKSVMKFKVVSEKTGQPLGFGLSIVRQLAHLVDSLICYIGYLFPLWDRKRQTLADKIMTTVCLPV